LSPQRGEPRGGQRPPRAGSRGSAPGVGQIQSGFDPTVLPEIVERFLARLKETAAVVEHRFDLAAAKAQPCRLLERIRQYRTISFAVLEIAIRADALDLHGDLLANAASSQACGALPARAAIETQPTGERMPRDLSLARKF
jgi:hypothetical protein